VEGVPDELISEFDKAPEEAADADGAE